MKSAALAPLPPVRTRLEDRRSRCPMRRILYLSLVLSSALRCGEAPTQPETLTPASTRTPAATPTPAATRTPAATPTPAATRTPAAIRTPAPTPTPAAPDLTGSWRGTLTYGTDLYRRTSGPVSCPSESIQVRLEKSCCWSEIEGSFQTGCMGRVYVNAWIRRTAPYIALGENRTLDAQDPGVSLLRGSVSSTSINVSSSRGTKLTLTR
jgi:hypothetical protein